MRTFAISYCLQKRAGTFYSCERAWAEKSEMQKEGIKKEKQKNGYQNSCSQLKGEYQSSSQSVSREYQKERKGETSIGKEKKTGKKGKGLEYVINRLGDFFNKA